MSETIGENKARAAATKKAVYEHVRMRKTQWDAWESHITDLMTDLCHLAGQQGIPPERLLDRALNHYMEETK